MTLVETAFSIKFQSIERLLRFCDQRVSKKDLAFVCMKYIVKFKGRQVQKQRCKLPGPYIKSFEKERTTKPFHSVGCVVSTTLTKCMNYE